MWMCRYISRCVKEAVDKSKGAFHCRAINGNENETVCYSDNFKEDSHNTKHNVFKDDEARTKNDFSSNFCLKRNVFQTLSCSTAMILGWCAGQIICLHERSSKTKCRRCEEFNKTLTTPFTNSYKKYVPLSLLLRYTALAQPLHTKISVSENIKPKVVNNEKINEHLATTKNLSEGLSEKIENAVEQFAVIAGNLENQFGTACIENSELVTSLEHFEAGTLHRNAAAAFNLGLCYELGLGTKKDFAKAAECYKVASELGNTKAMYNLAVYYAQGLGGLSVDFNKAHILFVRAAKKGHKESIKALSSDSVVPDYRKSEEVPEVISNLTLINAV